VPGGLPLPAGWGARKLKHPREVGKEREEAILREAQDTVRESSSGRKTAATP